MPFESLSKLKTSMSSLQDATETLANLGLEKTREVLAEVNLLLQLLQSAGYGVCGLDIELGLPPKATIYLKVTAAVKEEKLSAILHDQTDKKVVTSIIASLIQANKLRDSVTVDTLELDGVEILLTTTPNITMKWKDETNGKAA